MIPTHRRLLLPQAVDPDRVLKALQLRQGISKGNYGKQSRDLPPLGGGGQSANLPETEEQSPRKEDAPVRTTVQAQNSPITITIWTTSQEAGKTHWILLEGDVVISLTGDPTGSWAPDCLRGQP